MDFQRAFATLSTCGEVFMTLPGPAAREDEFARLRQHLETWTRLQTPCRAGRGSRTRTDIGDRHDIAARESVDGDHPRRLPLLDGSADPHPPWSACIPRAAKEISSSAKVTSVTRPVDVTQATKRSRRNALASCAESFSFTGSKILVRDSKSHATVDLAQNTLEVVQCPLFSRAKEYRRRRSSEGNLEPKSTVFITELDLPVLVEHKRRLERRPRRVANLTENQTVLIFTKDVSNRTAEDFHILRH